MIRDIVGTVSLVDAEDGAPVGISVMDQKENTTRCELKVAQELLAAVPSLEGKTVTADALHRQKNTARMILEEGGEYFFKSKPTSVIWIKWHRQAHRNPPFCPKLHQTRSD